MKAVDKFGASLLHARGRVMNDGDRCRPPGVRRQSETKLRGNTLITSQRLT